MVAAAVIGSAAVGAIGSSVAGSEAAGATRDASNAAIAQQNQALQQQAQLSAPYRSLGESAIPTLQNLLGIGGGSSSLGGSSYPNSGGGRTYNSATGQLAGSPGNVTTGPSGFGGLPNGVVASSSPMFSSGLMPSGGGPTGAGFDRMGGAAIPSVPGVPGANSSANSITDTLRNMPGYQFLQQQGQDSTVNRAAAMGLGLSGNTLQGLSQFNQGLADTQYQQFVGNLENVVGMGQAAAAGQAANIGNAAGNVSNMMVNQGNTLAGIDANTVAGITKSIGNGANQYMMMNTLNGLNNPNNNPANWDTENPNNFQDFIPSG